MKTLINRCNVKALIAVLSLAMAWQSHAALITFGGQTPTDGSQQTSAEVPDSAWINADGTSSGNLVTNIIDPSSMWFIETFDQATQNPFLPAGIYDDTGLSWLEIRNNGCGINSGGALNISGAGGFGVQQGNTAQAAHDNANSTCFAYAPHYGVTPANADALIDYTSFIASQGLGAYIGYLGLYFGSIDTYNSLQFGNINESNEFVAIDFNLNGQTYSTLSGTTILDELELVSGDRNGSNRYVNIFFDASEQFTAFRMINTTTRAFEVDNIVVGFSTAVNIPGPGTLGILGLGLIGISFCRKTFATKLKCNM